MLPSYRCLEAIVSRAFPDDPIVTVADLLRLGERLQYDMPDLSYKTPKKLEDLIKFQDEAIQSSRIAESEQSNRASSQEAENTSNAVSQRRSSAARLIKDTAGHAHYIGPSGSLTFFAEIRDLVASYQPSPYQGDNSRSKFALDNIAEALETEDRHEEGQNMQQEESGDQAENDGTSPLSAMSNYTTGTSHLDLDEQLKHLPPREVMETLIASYFEYCHDDLPLFHRATFQDEYESFILSAQRAKLGGQSVGESRIDPRPDHGWLACLHMMLVFGSLSTPQLSRSSNFDSHSVQSVSIAAAYSFLPILTTKCLLSNIQALLLLCIYFHNNNDRNAAWNLVGTATRMSFAIGLHQNDLDSQFRPVERETRKRIWCTLFTFEQFLCSSLGRPSGIGDPDVEVRVPKEGLLDGGIGAGERFAEESLRLQYILASARRLMGVRYQSHALDASKRASNVTQKAGLLQGGRSSSELTTDSILQELETWKNNLPSHLQLPTIKSDSIHGSGTEEDGMSLEHLRISLSRQNRRQLRALILLHIQYHYIVMLVSRPALLVAIASSSSAARDKPSAPSNIPRDGAGSSRSLQWTSVLAAAQISSLALLMDDFSLLNGISGLDIFYAYSSAMVLLLRTLWVQHRTENNENSKEFERKQSLRDLVSKLRVAVGKVRKSKTMRRFAGVMNKFGDVVDNINSSRAAVAGSDDVGQDGRVRDTMIAEPLSANVRGGHYLAQRSQPIFDPVGDRINQNHHQLDSTNNLSYPALSTTSINSNICSNSQPTWQPIQPPDPFSSSSVTQTTQFSYPLWPHMTSGGVPIANTATMSGVVSAGVNSPSLWYDDPLHALANGHIVDWTDLDAFINGQLA